MKSTAVKGTCRWQCLATFRYGDVVLHRVSTAHHENLKCRATFLLDSICLRSLHSDREDTDTRRYCAHKLSNGSCLLTKV